jgi:hypothetical protein
MLPTSLLLLLLVVAPSTLAQSPPCALGAYNNNGVCSTCPAGKVCLGGYYAQPSNCGTGKVATADGYSCIWDGTTGCSAGTYALAAVAKFVGSPYDDLCVPCPPFTVCTGGLNQPTVCPAGQTPNTNISATSCITTTSCLPGWYVYNGACWICPDLHYCTGGTALPTKCSPGLYPADALGRDQDQQVPVFGASACIRPSYCLSNEFPNATGCWPCEPGFTCNGGQWNPIAIPNYAPPTSCSVHNYLYGDRCMGCSVVNFNCPGGTALPQTHPSGTYSTNIDWKYYMGTQILFPYQPASNAFNGLRALPLSCPVGQYLNTDPRAGCASSPALYTCTPLGCLACPAGFSCAGGLSAPVACANGLVTNWNSTLGPIGSFCVQPDVPCPAGYVSTLVYSYPGFGYIKKPGYLSYSDINSNPLRNVNPSIKCMKCTFSLGSICPGGFVPLVDCQPGYSTDPMDLTKCVPTPLTCPPGYESNTNGGQTYPGGNAHCGSLAGQNRVSLGGNIPIWGSQCPSQTVPNDNNTLCITAPASVSSCDPGQYLGRINYVGRCLPCPAGYGCPGGYVTLLDKFARRCGLGKAPAANASTCLWDGITSCPPGQWGSDGSRFDQPYCNPCPSGAICAGGSALPVGCPSGQGPNPTSTACSVQTTCNAGYYLTNGRCSLCIVGHTCAGGTASPVLCPTRLVPLDAAGNPATVGYSMLDALGGGVNNAYDISIKGGFPAVSCGIPPSCPPGTYLNTTTGFEGCTSCPSGFACPGEYLVPVACTGSNIGLPPSAPTSCGLLSSVNAPYSCSIGYYVPSGGKYCEPCTPGVGCGQPCNQWSVFLNGQCTYVGSAATTCNPGKYLDTSYSLAVCIDCPSNSMCPGGTASYITCPAGLFSDSTKTKCILADTSCPVGSSAFWRLETATFPTGYLWTWGGLSKVTPVCEVCNSRFSCPGGFAPPRVCPDNAVSDLTTSLCRPMDTTCPVGYTLQTSGNGAWSGILFESTFLGDWNNNWIAGPSTSPTRCEKCDENTLCPAGTTGNPPLSSVCNIGFQPNQLNSACVSKPSSCPAGQYPLYGVCAACRSGSYCPGGGASPVACGSGKVPNSGATECVWDGTTVCAAGSYVNPLTTSSNNYCVACTTGNACAGGTAAPAACPAGQIVNSAASACAACPSGYVCLGSGSPAVVCGTGKAPNSGATACVWDGTTVCAAGTYINTVTSYNAAYCTSSCPSGSACAGGTAAPVACIVGQIVNSGASACASCPSGFYCPGGASAAVVCGTGKAPNSGATACVWDGTTVCAAGTYINTVTTYNAAYCANCTAGNVCYGGSAAPALCAAGEYVNSGATACFTPTSCNVGDFVNATGCFPCPSGSACAGGVAAPVACGAGQIVSLNMTMCVAAATTCSWGNFLYQGICRTCPVVSGITIYCPGGSGGLSCGPNLNLVTTCAPCPANANCYNTPFTCNSGYMYNSQGTGCIPIPPGPCQGGQYFNTTISGFPVCAPCPAGFVCVGQGASPTRCVSPRVPNSLVAAQYCYNPVTSCTGSNTLINGICVDPTINLLGSACTGSPSNALISRCAFGVSEGGAGASASIFCGNGQLTSEWRCRVSITNIICGNNWAAYYPALTNAQRAICASGASCDFNTNIGTTDGDGLTSCPCPGNATCSGSVRTCNAGYMFDSNGITCVQLPASCPAGQGPFNGVCTTCPTGYACPSGTLNGYAIIPSLCGTGKVPNSGATACVWDGTTVCAAGTYLNPLTSFSDNYCLPCPSGSACAGGTAAPVACIVGQIVNSGASACASCPSGFYCPGGASAAVVCGTGKAPNSGATACVWDGTTVCAAGTYINTVTTYNAAYCANCTAGNVCYGGSAAPALCAAGEYVNSGATACFTPTSCNVGDFVNATGCFPCPSGSACAGGVAAPVACGAGQIVSLNMTMCVTAEMTCAYGQHLYQGLCRPCPVISGSYISCNGGTSPLNCYSLLNIGSTCLPCTAGTYCTGSTPFAFSCQNGYMWNTLGCTIAPPGPCDPGTYLNTTINGVAVCAPCPVGMVCVGKGAPPGKCPSPRVPNGYGGADFCLPPITVCPSYMASTGVILNGICVYTSDITNGVAGTRCTGTPSTNLTSKCAAAITSGGANAAGLIRCSSGSGVLHEWQCKVSISQLNCTDVQLNSLHSVNLIGKSLCSPNAYCNTFNNIYSAQGNAVSGGSCQSSGSGGGGGGCTGAPPTCTLPLYSSCQGSSWACVAPVGGGGVSCTNNPATVTCTTPGNIVQCLPGSTAYTCAPAGSCLPPNMAPFANQYCTGGQAACGSTGKWECKTCSNTLIEQRQLCSGQSGTSCLTSCTDLLCFANQICPPGKYLNFPTQTNSPSYSGTCISPAAGSLSCPAGQFLVSSPFVFTPPASASNQPPPLSFQCVPCPAGYTCAGGTGAAAYYIKPTSASACPSTGTGYSAGSSTSGMSGGLSTFVGYSGSGSILFAAVGTTMPLTTPTPYCVIFLNRATSVDHVLLPFVSCDANFFSYQPSGSTLSNVRQSICLPCPAGTFSPGGFVVACSACPGTPPAYGSCPAGQTLKCSGGSWSCQAGPASCPASGGPSGPAACSSGSTWSPSGTAPCAACTTCTGPNQIVSTTCSATSDAVCGCDSGSTKDAAGTGCLPTAVVVMPYSISSPTLCSATGVVDSVLKPTSGVALSLRGNLSVALGIPSSAAFIVAVTACDSTTTLVAQNAPVNTAIVPGGIPGRRLQTAALNTSSLNLVIDGQTLVITLGFTIPNSVAPAMSAFLSASMSGTASPATMATLASNLQQSISSSNAASSPQLNSLLSSISSSPSSPSSSNAASAFSRRLNSVPVSAAAPLAASLGVSVASLGITNNTVKGIPSAIAVTGNPLAVSPTPAKTSDSGNGGLGGLGALVLLVILPACGYYFFVYRKKKQEGEEKKEKKEGSDVDGVAASSSSTSVNTSDISFDIVSPMHAGNKNDIFRG